MRPAPRVTAEWNAGLEQMMEAAPSRDLTRFFSAQVPQAAQLYSVLEGRSPGTVLLDRIPAQSWCVVRPAAGANTFVGGEITTADLSLALTFLLADDWACVAVGYNRATIAPLPFVHDVMDRVEFSDRRQDSEKPADALASLPTECTVKRMDRSLFDACRWREFHSRACGDAEQFLSNGIGYCMVRGGVVVCEGYAAFIGGGLADVGVITHPGHRRLGYAWITCAHVVAECERRGIDTRWACDAANTASVAVAHKLGYAQERRYALARYRKR